MKIQINFRRGTVRVEAEELPAEGSIISLTEEEQEPTYGGRGRILKEGKYRLVKAQVAALDGTPTFQTDPYEVSKTSITRKTKHS